MPHGSRIPRIPATPGAPGPGQGGAPASVSPFRRFTGRAPTSLDALLLLQAGGSQAESIRLRREAAGLPQQRQGVGTSGGIASTQPVTRARPNAVPGLPSSGEVIGSRFRKAFARRPFLF